MSQDPVLSSWSTELRRSGRVVLRPKRSATLLPMGAATLLLVTSGSRTVSQFRGHDAWGFMDYAEVVAAAAALPLLVQSVKNLLRGRDNLLVDNEGIELRDRRLRWHEIDRIDRDEDDDLVIHSTARQPIAPDRSQPLSTIVLEDTYPVSQAMLAGWLSTQLASRR
ncbi:hypothetical protein [Kribbella monticola]|uniref:hypothetical protein n=1 Tax=Kribbella monticola TaxID=2185285 RepID=UPI000DD3E596|nr:hypothetical protein [Kribbella monticola]